ncbi:Uncharacterized protein dnm_091830 [Desulfonema magnum]|uniref:Uncharacterized protein n=1 Tax=Desulfonema magnum TaxID=45655 RepID=A0A975GTH5_9BACT|nr:Uncharacterized protein dnm_091830 [Desulfonema magnum]
MPNLQFGKNAQVCGYCKICQTVSLALRIGKYFPNLNERITECVSSAF